MKWYWIALLSLVLSGCKTAEIRTVSHSDSTICAFASFRLPDGAVVWTTHPNYRKWITVAQERGLNCGVTDQRHSWEVVTEQFADKASISNTAGWQNGKDAWDRENVWEAIKIWKPLAESDPAMAH